MKNATGALHHCMYNECLNVNWGHLFVFTVGGLLRAVNFLTNLSIGSQNAVIFANCY